MSEQYVCDATFETPLGVFCYCPLRGDLDGDYEVVTGLNILTNRCPGELVAVVHEDGQGAVEAWLKVHGDALKAANATNLNGSTL